MSVELGSDGIILVGLLLVLAVALSAALFFRERQRKVLADREFLNFFHGATTAMILLGGARWQCGINNQCSL